MCGAFFASMLPHAMSYAVLVAVGAQHIGRVSSALLRPLLAHVLNSGATQTKTVHVNMFAALAGNDLPTWA